MTSPYTQTAIQEFWENEKAQYRAQIKELELALAMPYIPQNDMAHYVTVTEEIRERCARSYEPIIERLEKRIEGLLKKKGL
jgi:hypothetical protein